MHTPAWLTALALTLLITPASAGAQPSVQKADGLRVKGQYDHPMSRWHTALRVSDPWHQGDYFLYRVPEGFHVSGQPYLQQPLGTASWPTVQPEAVPEWRLEADEKSTGYTLCYYDGIELSFEARVGADEVTFQYVFRNGTPATIEPHSGSCLMLWTAPHFVDRRQDRTFVWIDQEPVALSSIPPTPKEMKRWPFTILGIGKVKEFEESKVRWMRHKAADHGLICTVSQDGSKAIGLAWPDAHTIFARSTIPCVHSEPKYPAIPPGKAVQATGKLYFSEGGIAAIHKRFQDDIERGAIHIRVID